MRPTPDLAGFANAQRALRQNLGVDVTFHVPQDPVWPPGTDLDPETGKPYDPWIEPESGGGFADVVKRVSVVNRPLGGGVADSAQAAPIGIVPSDRVAFIVDVDDYPDIEGATTATVYEQRFQISEARPDSMSSVERWLVYATKG